MLPALLSSRLPGKAVEVRRGRWEACVFLPGCRGSRQTCLSSCSHPPNRAFITSRLADGSPDGQGLQVRRGEAQPTWATVRKYGLLDSRKWTSGLPTHPLRRKLNCVYQQMLFEREKFTPHTRHVPIWENTILTTSFSKPSDAQVSGKGEGGGHGWQRALSP